MDMLVDVPDSDEVTQRARSAVGQVIGRIGHVRVRRRRLPNDGVLYETSNGLFFLPYQTVLATRLVEESGGSPLWSVAALLWSPLVFVLPFVRSKQLREKQVQETEPVRLTGDELQRLPELLGQMPGAFFVALRDLRSVDRKGNRWVLRRMSGTALTLAPLAGDAFGQRMRDLLDSDAWCVVAGWA
jgi:hypothetical protein